MKKISFICMMLVAAWSVQSCGNNSGTKEDSVDNAKEMNKDNKSVDNDDSKFAVEAANGGMLEVELGNLAQAKSQDTRVKNFGSMMVVDHTKANNELKALAANKNIAIPASLSEDEQKHVNMMKEKSGKDFDKAYMGMMVDDHKTDISDFEKAADKATDVDLKSFASSTLPTLRKHLDSAKAIHDAMK